MAAMVLGWSPFKTVSDIPVVHSRWLLLLNIEIYFVADYWFIFFIYSKFDMYVVFSIEYLLQLSFYQKFEQSYFWIYIQDFNWFFLYLTCEIPLSWLKVIWQPQNKTRNTNLFLFHMANVLFSPSLCENLTPLSGGVGLSKPCPGRGVVETRTYFLNIHCKLLFINKENVITC